MTMKRIVSLLFLSLLSLSLFLSLPLKANAAYTKGTVKALTHNLPHYIPGIDCTVSTAVNAIAANGKVYMIGDSITNGSSSELTTSLDAGFNEVIIDAKDSRSLSEGGSDLDGISVLEKNRASYNDANTVIIALGTNGGVTTENIDKTIGLIKDTGAKIFWVNVGVDNSKRNGGALDNASINKILEDNTAKGYSIIDWANQVKEHPDYIDPNPTTGLGVHPIGDGKTAFANTVATAVGTGNSVTNKCCASSTGSTDEAVSGETNAETIFLYFKSKSLTDEQAAGILGNIEHESGFNPRRVEGTPTPSGDSDTPDSRGYGIVQFTPGTKIVPAAQAAGKQPSDIQFQLDFIWEQFQSSESAAFEAIKAAQTLAEATLAFEVKYERHAGPPQQKRIDSAQTWLNKFRGKGGGPSGVGCGEKTNGEFNGYFQTDAEWKNIPYASGTVGSSGCGATSLASIISTLKGDRNITPATIVQDISEAGLLPTTVSLTPFTAIPEKYGLHMTSYSKGQFTQALDAVKNSNGDAFMVVNVSAGYWTSGGHYFVLRGFGPDGKIQVHDVGESTASHPKTDKTYDPEFFTSPETNPINYMVISK